MDITIHPRTLSGCIPAIPSKSQAHRLLICAAFAHSPTTLICPVSNLDIEATAGCLNALGAAIRRTETGYNVQPIKAVNKSAVLPCGESGSTLRFMLPIAGSLGVDATFVLSGRLPDRPLSPLWEEMERMGCHLVKKDNLIHCSGKLQCGEYKISGSISSQFITGLMFALSLLPGESTLQITGKPESAPYIKMTEDAMSLFGVHFKNGRISGNRHFQSPGRVYVEGDWSNGAFFIGANALGNSVEITGLNPHSSQGDKACLSIMDALSENITVCGQDIPDLIPILAVVAGAKNGASFENIGRLRLKESDRIEAVRQMLSALGCHVTVKDDILTVFPSIYHGCVIDARNDHRIAMAAAIASTVSDGPVTILGAQCVQKSYPHFWSDFTKLGGYYEQYIR